MSVTTPLINTIERVDRSIFEQLRLQLVNKLYLPDVAASFTDNITGVVQGPKQFKIAIDRSAYYIVGRKFTVAGSTGNNGTYTTVNSAFAASVLTITVVEPIPSAVADGNVTILKYYDDATGESLWLTDLTAVTNSSKGYAIEVFGIGSNFKKYEEKVPRIVILSRTRLPGALGSSPDRVYTPYNPDPLNPGSFTATVLPPQTSDFHYEICLVYETAAQNRILHQICALALPKRGYIDWWDKQPGEVERIFMRQIGYDDFAIKDQGYKESRYLYVVEDIFEVESDTVATNISPIKQISVPISTSSPTQPTADDALIIT